MTITLEIPLGDRLPARAAQLFEAISELATEIGVPAGPVSDGAGGASAGGGFAVAPAGPVSDGAGGASAGGRVAVAPAGPVPGTEAETLYVFPDSRTVVRDGCVLPLTRIEFDLLLFFCENPSRAFRRGELLRRVWGYDQAGVRTVDVHIRRLRVKTGVHRPLVTTVHGVGYRLDGRAQVSVVRAA